MNGETLKPFYHGQYDCATEYGAPWYFIHRVDLHNELKRLAQGPGDGFHKASIRLAEKVEHIDCERGIITTANNGSFTKDLVIAADGVHVSPYVHFLVPTGTC